MPNNNNNKRKKSHDVNFENWYGQYNFNLEDRPLRNRIDYSHPKKYLPGMHEKEMAAYNARTQFVMEEITKINRKIWADQPNLKPDWKDEAINTWRYHRLFKKYQLMQKQLEIRQQAWDVVLKAIAFDKYLAQLKASAEAVEAHVKGLRNPRPFQKYEPLKERICREEKAAQDAIKKTQEELQKNEALGESEIPDLTEVIEVTQAPQDPVVSQEVFQEVLQSDVLTSLINENSASVAWNFMAFCMTHFLWGAVISLTIYIISRLAFFLVAIVYSIIAERKVRGVVQRRKGGLL